MKTRKRNLLTLLLMALLTAGTVFGTSFSSEARVYGEWKHNEKGYWYEYASGEYETEKWDYLDGKWYSLEALPGRYDDSDPIGVLDVTILSNLVLDSILGIKDLRTDKRIDFVGGIRGLGELSRRVDSGEMKVAFALYPVSMGQLIDIADTGNIMPPKTTWFEPKLRSGLFIHSLD